MRYKSAIIAIAASLMIFLSCGGLAAVFAADGEAELNQNIDSILSGLDLSALDEYLASHGNDFLFSFGDNAKEIILYLINGNLGVNYSGYIQELCSVLFANVISMIPSFAQITGICILCALVKSAEGGLVSESTSQVVRLACYALIIAIIAAMLTGIVSSATESINTVRKQIEIITPILVTLTIMAGGSSSGAIYQPSALFISGGAVEIVSGIIFPAAIAVLVINFISKLAPDISFSGTSKLIKSILKWIIGITLAVFSLFLTVQSTASSIFDGIFFKATKYLVGNSVPIVGNYLSAGVDMIVAAGSVIRSSVGICGIVLLISVIAPPIIMFAAFSIILKVVAAIAEPLGEKTLYSMFSDLASDIEYFIAGLCTVAFMYALVVMMIINSASNFL